MKSVEQFVAPQSDYFIYTPSRQAAEMLLYPMQCGHFVYQPGYSLTRESFDSFLLMYIQKGKMSLTVDGQTCTVKADSFVLLDCYKMHSYSSAVGWESIWCHFDGVTARSIYNSIVSRLGSVFCLPNAYHTVGKLSSILNVFYEGLPVREPQMHKYLTDILIYSSRSEFQLH